MVRFDLKRSVFEELTLTGSTPCWDITEPALRSRALPLGCWLRLDMLWFDSVRRTPPDGSPEAAANGPPAYWWAVAAAGRLWPVCVGLRLRRSCSSCEQHKVYIASQA